MYIFFIVILIVLYTNNIANRSNINLYNINIAYLYENQKSCSFFEHMRPTPSSGVIQGLLKKFKSVKDSPPEWL